LRVRIPLGTCSLERDSDVLVDQILAWDNSLFHKELGRLPDGLIEKVTAALKDFLDI
jgi:mRNA-degrading endonuclease toxin of MazEF toxin-antitoxin module